MRETSGREWSIPLTITPLQMVVHIIDLGRCLEASCNSSLTLRWKISIHPEVIEMGITGYECMVTAFVTP